MAQKTIIFLGDGMADEPVEQLGGQTPLQVAKTPAMDRIAREGCSGSLLTLPEGFPTSSDVANMGVLGCNLESEYCGRGPLEAAGRGIHLAPDTLAFRLNLLSVDDGQITDFSGGHLPQEESEKLVEMLQANFGDATVEFHPGVSYRNLMLLKTPPFHEAVTTEKPDDNVGSKLHEHLPVASATDGLRTAAFLRELTVASIPVLETASYNRQCAAAGKPQANGVWPWSGGRAGAIRTLRERYGIAAACISAVDVINGLGHCLGMDVIPVEGATGYVDTNYEGKADAAVEAIHDHDLVYVHVEAIDEVSHAKDLELKIDTIEQFDSRVIQRVMQAAGNDVAFACLPDHPVPIRIGKHTRTPVPVSLLSPEMKPDTVEQYNEITCPGGALGHMVGVEFMNILFGVKR